MVLELTTAADRAGGADGAAAAAVQLLCSARWAGASKQGMPRPGLLHKQGWKDRGRRVPLDEPGQSQLASATQEPDQGSQAPPSAWPLLFKESFHKLLLPTLPLPLPSNEESRMRTMQG